MGARVGRMAGKVQSPLHQLGVCYPTPGIDLLNALPDWITLYVCGSSVQLIASLPSVLDHTSSVAGLAVAIVLIGFGVGSAKASITPFIGTKVSHSWEL